MVSCCCAGLRDMGVRIFRVAAMPLGDVGYKVYVFVVFAVVRLAEDLFFVPMLVNNISNSYKVADDITFKPGGSVRWEIGF